MKTSPPPAVIPQYFNCIDMVRMLAALMVVIFHYHHFYLASDAARAAIPPLSQFPHARLLGPVFAHGDKAVEFFWIVSGYVFAHVYLASATSLGQFILARVARLYPLHLVSLIVVAVLQTASMYYVGHWQIYGNNDTRHFLFQLVLASNSTSLAQGLSFNGPIWSVSLEIGAYFIFFLSLPLLRRMGLVAALALAGLFWWVALTPELRIPVINLGVFLCAGYFFTGVVLYLLFRHLAPYRAGLVAAIIAAVALALVTQVPQLRDLAVSCAILLAAALVDRQIGAAGAWMRSAGNISYSLYLVHVPLQMGLLLAADEWFGRTRAFADSPLLLPVYLVVVIVVSSLAFIYIERPAGRRIRQLASWPNRVRRVR